MNRVLTINLHLITSVTGGPENVTTRDELEGKKTIAHGATIGRDTVSAQLG